MSAKTDAFLAIGRSIARNIGVPLSELTKDMVRKAPVPVRYKKLFFGPNTSGEARIAPSIKSSRAVAIKEAQALGTGAVIGSLGTSVTDQILSAVKNKEKEKKKAKPNVRSGVKTGTKKKPKITKPMGFAAAAKDKQIKSSSKKAVKKALSSQSKKKVTKPKPRPGSVKKPIPKIKPKQRP